MKKLAIALTFLATLYVSALADAQKTHDCARLVKMVPWEVGQEEQMDCEQVGKIIMSTVKSPPKLNLLARSSFQESKAVLGDPFHNYIYDGEVIAFFCQDGPIVIYYDERSGKPTKILMHVAASNINELTSFLGLKPLPVPLTGPVGPFWNDIQDFAQIELHNPDYKYNGRLIYPVIFHIDGHPISEEFLSGGKNH